MSIISSSWTCPGLVHITEHTANAHLLRFLKACVLQIEQKNFITTYDSVKAVYSELQIMESLFANPPSKYQGNVRSSTPRRSEWERR